MIVSSNHIVFSDFEKMYAQIREQEGRIYTDEEVAELPCINESHPHYKEWRLRKDSSQKLIDSLKKKKQSLNILEVGCGNGWLSHRLSEIPKSKVIGIDINFTEVQQAARVFHQQSNLNFIYGPVESGMFKEQRFDVIIFAASIQYFISLNKTILSISKLLRRGGYIHIIDSPFYTLSELGAARQRSLLYYETAGFPEMTNWYFHHTLEELDSYNYTILYDPNGLFNKFLRNKNPFHWLCIKF